MLLATSLTLWAALVNGRSEVAGTAEVMMRLNLSAGQDSECSSGPSVDRDTCLGKGKCMFLELDQRNLCAPCEWAGAPVPCVPAGAAYPQGRVKDCQMSCEHQQVVSKVSDCTDVSGDINMEDCYSKGKSAGISCIWTAFKRSDGSRRTMCGPCKVDGYGVVGRSAPGSLGPEPGSLVESSFSQCEDEMSGMASRPCFDPAGCPTALPPMPPGKGDEPVVMSEFSRLGLNTTVDAPKYYGAPVAPPYGKEEFEKASKAAAEAAGWKPSGDFKNYDLAFVEPEQGPKIPSGISSKSARPLPGLLFPVPAFKPGPGILAPGVYSPGPGILAEPGNSFTPRYIMPETSLLQAEEAPKEAPKEASARKLRLRRRGGA
eukprot:TRINITY_DN67163_c0_g1_i1.p1 TRINITY_DN67163_c0_g1~~TRINITY_DN67163_c0_g1_i1.p1  ORF type:complete len:373 (-),score=76.14 TRINITY_DN67163_c0_g1_i1:36-1154(-)